MFSLVFGSGLLLHFFTIILFLLADSVFSRRLSFVLRKHHRHQKVGLNRSSSFTRHHSSLCNMTSKLATDDSVIICDILRTSLQRHVDNNEHQNTFIIDTLNQSSNLIQRLGSEALAIAEQPSTIEQSSLADCDENDLSSSLSTLSTQSLSTCQSLLLLVNQLNSRSKSKKTSGNAWRTLQSVIDQSICIKNNYLLYCLWV